MPAPYERTMIAGRINAPDPADRANRLREPSLDGRTWLGSITPDGMRGMGPGAVSDLWELVADAGPLVRRVR